MAEKVGEGRLVARASRFSKKLDATVPPGCWAGFRPAQPYLGEAIGLLVSAMLAGTPHAEIGLGG